VPFADNFEIQDVEKSVNSGQAALSRVLLSDRLD